MGRYSKEEYKSGQHALDEKQVKALLLTFDDIQEKAMIALAVAIGLRREDLVSIKKKDYDPQKKTVIYYEKKKKRTRTIFVPSPEAVQLLNMHLKTCRNSQWLFPSPKETGIYRTTHISSRHVYDILNEHLDKADIERRPFHSLRATCYKLAQAKGWSMRKAAELLGDTLRVAEDHYNAPSRREMEEIAEEKPLF
jgi:integrase